MVCQERTLILIKPDGVARGLVGEILTRFEKVGLKIIGLKMKWVDESMAKDHYTQDIAERRGEAVRASLLQFIKSGPVIAMCITGVNAIGNVRKLVGSTEPKSALPGTIRGDYAHISFQQADHTGKAVQNLIHASSDAEDAKREVELWFTEEEMHNYKSVHEIHTF